MDIPKSIIFICCATICLASHHSHTIPVEGYDSELQDLGEHVQTHETPVRVIKITKTVAVKVPVPYPVKVVEKVPYPVHVNKPYPVPVPHIVKVPVAHYHHGQEALDVGQHGHQLQDRQHDGNSYQVQEQHHEAPATGESYDSGSQSYDGGNNENSQSYDGGNNENSYGAPNEEYSSDSSYHGQAPQNYHAQGDQDGHNSVETKSYDLAIQNYLNNLNGNKQFGGSNGYH